VSDDSRILDSIPTLKFLIEKKARIILEPGWLGRPKGEDAELSMACVANRLSEELKKQGLLVAPVLLAPNSLDGSKPRSVYRNKDEVAKAVASIRLGQVLVLENSRYDAEENSADEQFGSFLASLAGKGALYVNEAEAQSHRPCASATVTPIKIAENGGDAVLGMHFAKAAEYIGGIGKALRAPGRGKFVFFLTGKKIETAPGITSKITVASNLLDLMREGDVMVVQGAIAYTFLLADMQMDGLANNSDAIAAIVADYNAKIKQASSDAKKSKEPGAAEAAAKTIDGLEREKSAKILGLLALDEKMCKVFVGNSFVDYRQLGQQLYFAYSLISKAESKKVQLVTGIDHIITDQLPNKSGQLPANAKVQVFSKPLGIPTGFLGVAPGPATISAIASAVSGAAIVLVAGPIAIEDSNIEQKYGVHRHVFDAIAKAKDAGAITVAAGGDTAATVNRVNAKAAFSIVSNAGGATLELIEKGTSPGLEAVEKANKIAASKK
jgi:3-phosphoglycerate kinase